MRRVEQTVYLTVDLADDIQIAAQSRDQSVSEFFREAARRELQRMENDA